jgi:hypothetical protein
MLNYTEIQLEAIKSDVTCKCYVDDTERILVAEISGTCRNGAIGGFDITKAVSLIASYYSWIEPSALILDLTNFEYTFGNSIYKLLNITAFLGRDDIEKNIPFTIVFSKENSEVIFNSINISEHLIGKKYFFDVDDAKSVVENQLED